MQSVSIERNILRAFDELPYRNHRTELHNIFSKPLLIEEVLGLHKDGDKIFALLRPFGFSSFFVI